MEKIIKTAGILIFKKDNVLLVKHTQKAEHQTGTYGIPAGRINSNETEKETAVREIIEETGLKVEKRDLQPLSTLYTAKIKREDDLTKEFSLQVFFCKNYSGELFGDEKTIPEWIPIKKLDNYKLLPNMKKIILDGLSLYSKH